jgi:hypothetical protein
LRLANERLEAPPQLGGGGVVEAVVDLAGIDQVVALAAGQIHPVPLALVEREAGDGQRLALRAGFLDPVVAAADRVGAVSHL